MTTIGCSWTTALFQRKPTCMLWDDDSCISRALNYVEHSGLDTISKAHSTLWTNKTPVNQNPFFFFKSIQIFTSLQFLYSFAISPPTMPITLLRAILTISKLLLKKKKKKCWMEQAAVQVTNAQLYLGHKKTHM